MNNSSRTSSDKIDRKLAVSFGAVVLLLMLTATGVASYQFLTLQIQEENQLTRTIASILSESISQISFSGKHHARLLAKQLYEQTPALAYISVETTNGVVLAHSDPAQSGANVSAEDLETIGRSIRTGESIFGERTQSNRIIKEVAVPYKGGFDNQVIGVVRVGVRVHEARQEQRATLLLLLALVGILTAAAMGAVYLLSYRFGGEVRSLASQLQGVLAHAPFAIAISDRAGRVLVQSAEFESMFGSGQTQCSLRQAFAKKLPEKELNRLGEMDRQVLDEGINVEQELSIDTLEKPRVWHVSKSPIARDKNGRVILNFTLIRDISNHRQLEEQLRHSQKMDAVGQLAGGIAHDFNNKLQAILGYADFALEEVDSRSTLYDNLTEIRNAAQHSAALTSQLLAYARKQVASPKSLNLNDAVSGMLKMLGRLIGENISLTWQPGHNLWNVKMDPSQLDQILANLLVNARDAISGTGNILIQTGNLVADEMFCAQYSEIDSGNYVLLSVSDDGCGMDKATLSRVFDPFFTTKAIGKGTGLGLATVYGIVKQNNGCINVVSEPGKGTTFRIYLPRCNDKDADTKTDILGVSVPGGKETVLLVEDEKPLLNLGKSILERLGYSVLAAQAPSQAILLAANHSGTISLLVTDVVMPEMNGRELANRIVAMNPSIKCLFVSGYSSNVIENSGAFYNGAHFLQKPFSAQVLAEKVRETLESKPVGEPLPSP